MEPVGRDRGRSSNTPALSNALDALRIRPHNTGYSNGSIQRVTGAAPMVGRAVTARMVAREPGTDGVPVSQLHKATADKDGPVVVVIQDCDEPAGAGAFLGEVNGSLLAALNIQGLVTNGRVRDVNELRRFPYAVYASGLCVARSYMRLIEVGTEVTIAGMTVRPGDLLHGDEHGVLQIPAEAVPDLKTPTRKAPSTIARRSPASVSPGLIQWKRSATTVTTCVTNRTSRTTPVSAVSRAFARTRTLPTESSAAMGAVCRVRLMSPLPPGSARKSLLSRS